MAINPTFIQNNKYVFISMKIPAKIGLLSKELRKSDALSKDVFVFLAALAALYLTFHKTFI